MITPASGSLDASAAAGAPLTVPVSLDASPEAPPPPAAGSPLFVSVQTYFPGPLRPLPEGGAISSILLAQPVNLGSNLSRLG